MVRKKAESARMYIYFKTKSAGIFNLRIINKYCTTQEMKHGVLLITTIPFHNLKLGDFMSHAQ